MLCQNCNKRTAKVHFKKIVNENKVEMFLCEQCANEKSGFSFSINMPYDLNNLITKFMGVPTETASLDTGYKCDNCGMDFHEFQRIGKMGCSKCYEVFGEEIKPLLKRVHGGISHTGRVPKKAKSLLQKTREIDHLQHKLNEVIKEERYEEAAVLRDKIRELKNCKTNPEGI